jgi:hypothetical protein
MKRTEFETLLEIDKQGLAIAPDEELKWDPISFEHSGADLIVGTTRIDASEHKDDAAFQLLRYLRGVTVED